MGDPSDLFRPGLLAGVVVGLGGPVREAVQRVLAALGAEVRVIDVASDEDAPPDAKGLHVLVVDASAAFASAPHDPDELAPLRAAADTTWTVTRAIANAAWITPRQPGGKVVFLAPRPNDGPHAGAARAALENLARTLSIEWARYGIRTTTLTPDHTWTDDDVAGIVAYLASKAGDYFSGARLGGS